MVRESEDCQSIACMTAVLHGLAPASFLREIRQRVQRTRWQDRHVCSYCPKVHCEHLSLTTALLASLCHSVTVRCKWVLMEATVLRMKIMCWRLARDYLNLSFGGLRRTRFTFVGVVRLIVSVVRALTESVNTCSGWRACRRTRKRRRGPLGFRYCSCHGGARRLWRKRALGVSDEVLTCQVNPWTRHEKRAITCSERREGAVRPDWTVKVEMLIRGLQI